ncbi:MAG: MFS transporter [Patescibacteria group bacterium]
MNKTFFLIALVSFLNSLSFTILIPTIYPYALQLGLNDFQSSLLLTTFSFAQFFATPIMGRISDRYGRRPLLLISLFGTLVANIIASIALSAPLLFFARFLDGVTGGNVSLIQAMVVDSTNKESRAKGFGIMGSMFGAGFVLGPVLAIVAQKLEIPFINVNGRPFFLSAMMAGLALILTFIFLKETMTKPNFNPITIHDLGFNKLIPSLFKPRIGRIFVISFLNGLVFTIFTFAFQPFFLKQLNGTVELLAWAFTTTGLISVLSHLFLGRITKSFGVVNSLYTALFIRGTLLLVLSFLTDLRTFFVFVIAFAFFNLAMSLINTLVSISSEDTEQGTNAGLNSSYNSLSNALGPAIAGMLLNFGVQFPIWVAGITMILLSLYIHSERKELVK